MDVMKLSKKSVLVPTPGQGEQQYLADYLSGNHFAFAVQQRDFSMKAIEDAKRFEYRLPAAGSGGSLREAVAALLADIKTHHHR
jgi:hypothetical protein